MRKIQIACVCFVLLVAAGSARAQEQQTANEAQAGCVTVSFQAAHLAGKDVKFNVIVPQDYAASDRRFPVLYLLHGFDGHYENWCTLSRLADYAGPYEEIIIMPEGNNSWYVNSYSDPKMQWENYIIDDLIPYVDSHYRTVASRSGRAIAGLSMGGYGALFLGLKHHEMFAAVASLSGVVAAANFERWDVQTWNQIDHSHTEFFRSVRKTQAEDFGPAATPLRDSEDPFALIRKLTPASCPQLYVAIGFGDSLLYENREFVALLSELKMPYRYAEVPGGHEWKVWDEQIQRVLALEAPVIGSQSASKK